MESQPTVPQPKREAARFSDHLNRRSKDSSSKKLQKITKKKLLTAFNSVSEKETGISKETVDFSAFSEVSDADHIEDISDVRPRTVHTYRVPISASEYTKFKEIELIAGSDFELTSKMNCETGKTGSTCSDNFGFCRSKDNSVEEELAIGLLRDAQSEVRKSAYVASNYKKLLDGLIDITVQELRALPQERDRLAEIPSAKTRALLMSLLLCLIAVSVVLFFCSGMGRKYIGPLPT